jgi:hypothetical protein
MEGWLMGLVSGLYETAEAAELAARTRLGL